MNTQMPKNELSCRDAWRDEFAEAEDSYKEILTWDPFEDWELNAMPESTAETNLESALEILYSGKGKKYATRFLQITLDVLDRAFAENKFRSKKCKYGVPHNLGSAARVQQYAQALQNGKFSEQALLESGANYEKWTKRQKWDAMS